MRYLRKAFTPLFLIIWPALCFATAPQLTVTAVNNLSFGRLNQTIELSADQLAPLGNDDLDKIHIKDTAGRELLCQAVDTDGDEHPDEVIFQADFGPRQTRHFYVFVGNRLLYTPPQFKAYGRFVRERSDDFAWENDRIADRAYGKALETSTKGGPLTSSAIDVWGKSVRKLVINDWYMTGHMETDTGEGADLYRAGDSRGVGGGGLWQDGKLWAAANHIDSQVMGNGPIRVMFTLSYEPFNIDGYKVTETRQITLDAGQNLNHYKIHYKTAASQKLVTGVGIEKTDLTAAEVRKGVKPDHSLQSIERSPGAFTQKDVNKDHGWMTTQQPLSEGQLNAAIIVNPKDFVKVTEDSKNELVLARVPANHTISYWAGFTWSRSGQFKDYNAWKTYIDHFAQECWSPIEVTISDR